MSSPRVANCCLRGHAPPKDFTARLLEEDINSAATSRGRSLLLIGRHRLSVPRANC